MKRTISAMTGKGSLTHNNRDFIADNIDKSRVSDNIIYCHDSLKQVYEELFGAALQRYNDKQKRSDRRIENYYEHIRTGKQEKLYHEVIFQMGNVKDTAVGTTEGEQAKVILDEFMKGFERRNPHLRVFSAHLHLDEATPHLHIDFVPFTTDSKRGLDTRVSLKKALAAQGFEGGSRGDTELNQWRNSEKAALAEIMRQHGIEWEQLDTHNEHLTVLDFKKQERTAEVKALEQSLGKLKQKQVDIQAVEQIAVKPVPLSSKVKLDAEDYQTLVTAAKAFVVQEKKERRLQKLLDAANATIAKLRKTLQEVTAELADYKSVKGQLRTGALEQENGELKRQNAHYQDILRQHGFSHLLGGRGEKTQKREMR